MPSLPAQLILTLELILILSGCALLWRHGISPAGRQDARERAAAMPTWSLTVPRFLLYLWLVISGGVLAQSISVLALKSVDLDDTTALIINGGTFHGGMLLGILLFKILFDQRPIPAPARLPWGKVLQYGAGTFLVVLPVIAATALLWQYLMKLFGVYLEEQDLIGIFANTKSPFLLVLMIVLATVVAPVTEELIFRGGLFRYARTRAPRWVALLAPALLFACLHANLASFAPLAALGIIFSLAYERTGSIAVPMIAHGLFNLNTIVLILAGVTA